MSENNGFTVNLSILRELSGQLVDLAKQAAQQAEVLNEVRADTGRADSDDVGQRGPIAVAKLVKSLCETLRGDSSQLDQCVMRYADAERNSEKLFQGNDQPLRDLA